MNPKDKKVVTKTVVEELSKKPVETKKDVEIVTERVMKKIQRKPVLRKRLGPGLKLFIVTLIFLYVRSLLVRQRRPVKKFKPFTGFPRYLGKNRNGGVPPNIGGQNVMAFAAMKRQGLTPTTIRRVLSERRATLRPSPTMRPRTLSGRKKVAGMSNLPKSILNRYLNFKPNNR